jgi:hypothetical protein
MVFLPGLDSETAQYAAKRIGRTTVLQHTSVDAPGSKFDNERDSETGRDLLDAAEMRQMVEHSQAVAITGTAPPVIFGFPPLGKGGPVAHPLPREVARAIPLRDAEEAHARLQAEQAAREVSHPCEDSHLEDSRVADSDISITDERGTPQTNVSSATVISQPAASVTTSSTNMDAGAILGRVATTEITKTGWEADLNQPRQP